ncbi:type III PLP-dependent enzyme domain-containing protein [Portibacter lacus]|nr:hypothetical protein [Portibacter lacus]
MSTTKLTPILHNWVQNLKSQPSLLREAIEEYGSPLNIHNLEPFYENVNKYNEVFSNLNIQGKAFFARKANRCLSLLTGTHQHNYGIDTASYHELKQSLDQGVSSHNLVVTAAVKPDQLLELAIKNDVLIIIDNQDEVQAISRLADGKKVNVGFRLSGFKFNGSKAYSRFGIDILDAKDFITEHLASHPNLIYKGLHFHLDGYDLDQRRSALSDCIALSRDLEGTEFIDIGGGLLMNYLQSEEEWEAFDKRLRQGISGKSEEVTYRNNGLGYELVNGQVTGKLKTYPYYNNLNKDNALQYILEGEIADQLRAAGIELRIEPGRSLLDQVGFTIAKVIHRKKDQNGDHHIGLEMNMTQMLSGSADFLLDPIVLYNNSENLEPVDVYFTGAYCLERDVLLKRKISLDRLPEVNDLVIFPNTAGYMMHFFESEAHQFPLAKNVFVENKNGVMEFSKDQLSDVRH